MTRRLRARLFEYAALCAVVLAYTEHTGAQSQPPNIQRSRAGATGAKPAERADVARFRNRAEAALSAPGADKGFWGALVTDAATGEVLYARNADGLFAPASGAKLFTTALALAALGPDYRIRTTLTASGMLDENGLLKGDLVLTGRGDANLSNRKFPFDKKVERIGPPETALAALADAAVARGVKEIAGNVVADDSLFQWERFPSGWTIDDMLWSYGAAVSAIAVNDNTFTLDLRPGEHEGDAATFFMDPASDFYTIDNEVRTSARGSEEKLTASREPGSRTIHLTGTLPAGAPPRRLTFAIEEPAEYAAALLARLLEARGVQIHGVPRARHAGDPASGGATLPPDTILAERMSLPLAEDIRATNKASENLHAELLLLLAAHEKAGTTSREDALKFASDFFRMAGIADGDVVLTDGSGLSRRDLVTPRALVQILQYAAKQPWGELYRSSLPVAGEDGTLSDRMKNTSAADHIYAKTGTIDHAVSLSGYATTLRGAHLIFSICGNNDNLHPQAAHNVLDAIAVAMVEELEPAPQDKRTKKK